TVANATTLVAKRDAARAIVDPRPASPGPDGVFGTDCDTANATAACQDDVAADVRPPDADAFLFGTLYRGLDGAVGGGDDIDWSNNAAGVTKTGMDEVDLWGGGVAEVTNLFGGLLGSTFNYVFQTQLEKLQDNDRLYYLNRTPGMNLRTQLESNSFTEMIQRNTDGTSALKSDAFGTADCKFILANLHGTAADFQTLGSIVTDDPTTECQENLVLQRMPDGTIQYKTRNTVDPPGINGQSVYEGTPGVDRVNGGNDNDTFWGAAGDDFVEGNGGGGRGPRGGGGDHPTHPPGAGTPQGRPGKHTIHPRPRRRPHRAGR